MEKTNNACVCDKREMKRKKEQKGRGSERGKRARDKRAIVCAEDASTDEGRSHSSAESAGTAVQSEEGRKISATRTPATLRPYLAPPTWDQLCSRGGKQWKKKKKKKTKKKQV